MIATPLIFLVLMAGAGWALLTQNTWWEDTLVTEQKTKSISYRLLTAKDFANYESVELSFGTSRVHAELAVTSFERLRGLSGKNPLGENEGLLFVFPHMSSHGIWMKDMFFAIDIIWLDNEFRVVGIKENATPESYPEVFTPERDARYVLEVNTGFVEKHGIQVDDVAKVSAVTQQDGV